MATHTALPASQEIRVSIGKCELDQDAHIIRGEVYPPFDPQEGVPVPVATVGDVVDTWGTFIRSDQLAELAHKYLRFCRNVDKQHDETRAGEPIESFIAPEGCQWTPKSWVMAVTTRLDGRFLPSRWLMPPNCA